MRSSTEIANALLTACDAHPNLTVCAVLFNAVSAHEGASLDLMYLTDGPLLAALNDYADTKA